MSAAQSGRSAVRLTHALSCPAAPAAGRGRGDISGPARQAQQLRGRVPRPSRPMGLTEPRSRALVRPRNEAVVGFPLLLRPHLETCHSSQFKVSAKEMPQSLH